MNTKRDADDDNSTVITKQAKTEPQVLQLNKKYLNKDFIESFTANWQRRSSFTHEDSKAELCQVPFCHVVLPAFINNDSDVDKLQDELFDMDFAEKNNDLYKFHQSKEDLKTSKAQHVKAFRQMMCSIFKEFLTQVTGIPLNDVVDMFCAKYISTDNLLCHDDELEGRRIAYIYYLVDDWNAEDGGALDLFNVDENIQPLNVVKSILPARNNLVFFEVSPGSFHQVAEVISEDKVRLSIGGWFHGPPISHPSPFLEAPPLLCSYSSIEDDVFFDWINPVYLSVGAQGSIQEKFEEESEIELQDFLVKEKFDALQEALRSPLVTWNRRGPPNKRCYDQADVDKLPEVVQTCVTLFQSDAMFLLLSNFTGLNLHELAGEDSNSEEEKEEEEEEKEEEKEEKTAIGDKEKVEDKARSAATEDSSSSIKGDEGKCTARCRSEVRRWSRGCYTLVHDTDTEGSEFALDLVLHIDCQDWLPDNGGFTSYIAKGEDEELLTVSPSNNSLALVYRDRETLKFVKHINHRTQDCFFDISSVYYE